MKNKKTIIMFSLIILLLIVAIIVNIIALNGRNNIEKNNQEKNKVSTQIENNVENDIITEEDLELTGDKYISAKVKDENDTEVEVNFEENMPMILVFWNLSEDKSVEALKNVQTYYETYNEKVAFKSIVVEDVKKEKIENFITENSITIPVLYDTLDKSLSNANGVTQIPTILMINKSGEIINTLTDEINEDIIEANLDILSENY